MEINHLHELFLVTMLNVEVHSIAHKLVRHLRKVHLHQASVSRELRCTVLVVFAHHTAAESISRRVCCWLHNTNVTSSE